MTAPDHAAVEECRATWWRGCRWEGRYDMGAPTLDVGCIRSARAERVHQMFLDSRPQTYVRDVCARCGATKERRP